MLLLKQELEVADIKFLTSFDALDDDHCWTWEGYFSKGYPALYVSGKQGQATHYSYRYFKGEEVPQGYTVTHTCKNKACVNHNHLKVVARGEHLKNPSKPKSVTFSTASPVIVIDENGQLQLTDRGYRRIKALTRTRNAEEISKMFKVDLRVVKAIRDNRPFKHLGLVG